MIPPKTALATSQAPIVTMRADHLDPSNLVLQDLSTAAWRSKFPQHSGEK